jgi:hypothetical protein
VLTGVANFRGRQLFPDYFPFPTPFVVFVAVELTRGRVYLSDDTRQRFMGTVGVPDRYRLPKGEVQYLYCHPGPDGKLIEAKYFGKVRDIEIAECCVRQLKVKADDSDPIES